VRCIAVDAGAVAVAAGVSDAAVSPAASHPHAFLGMPDPGMSSGSIHIVVHRRAVPEGVVCIHCETGGWSPMAGATSHSPVMSEATVVALRCGPAPHVQNGLPR